MKPGRYFLTVIFATQIAALLSAQECEPGKLLVRFNPDVSGSSAKTAKLFENAVPAYPFLQNSRFKGKSGANNWDKPARTLLVSIDAALNPEWEAMKLRRLPEVELAEPVCAAGILDQPNDPQLSQQLSLQLVGAAAAWDIQQSGAEAVIAIVDTGVDYLHPDLNGNLWTNPGESGVKSTNGLDDDGNGFVDDVNGWDFAENDNTPLPGASTHGTHVAGIAAAVTGNSQGIASLSRNARFMPVRAGVSSIPFGYEGILYAAANGAHIINCSWGATRFTQAGLEAVQTAAAAGALVIGAAGNEGTRSVYFPAAFPEAVSVAATVQNEAAKAGFSNYNVTVDISAPGADIYSTLPGSTYGISSGTSMAAPLVSALAALVKTRNPQWSMNQVRANVLSASKTMPLAGQPWDNLTGQGVLWAPAALGNASSNLEIVEARFSDNRSPKADGIFEENEDVDLFLTLANRGVSASYSLKFTSSLPQQLSTPGGSTATGMMAANSLLSLPAIPLRVEAGALTNSTPLVFIDVSGGTAPKRLVAQTVLKPSYGTINANNVELTIAANGRLGLVQPGSQTSEGSPFIVRGEGTTSLESLLNKPLLSVGSLMIGMQNSGPISDATRSGSSAFSLNEDFITRRPFKSRSDGENRFEVGAVEFADNPASGLGVLIQTQIAGWRQPEARQAVVLEYKITAGSTPFSKLRAGLHMDFDLPVSGPADDEITYDPANDLVYQTDTSRENASLFVGGTVYGGSGAAWLIRNDSKEGSINFGIQDGFTDDEKRLSLFFGPAAESLGPADVSFVLPSPTFDLPANGSRTIHFILAYGTTLQELTSQVQQAKLLIDAGVPSKTETSERPVTGFEIVSAFPNPFNPSSQILVENTGEPLTIELFDATGKAVAVLARGERFTGGRTFLVDGKNLSSGVYLLRVKNAGSGRMLLKKLTLIK